VHSHNDSSTVTWGAEYLVINDMKDSKYSYICTLSYDNRMHGEHFHIFTLFQKQVKDLNNWSNLHAINTTWTYYQHIHDYTKATHLDPADTDLIVVCLQQNSCKRVWWEWRYWTQTVKLRAIKPKLSWTILKSSIGLRRAPEWVIILCRFLSLSGLFHITHSHFNRWLYTESIFKGILTVLWLISVSYYTHFCVQG